MIDQGPQTYDAFYDRVKWKLMFAWLPERCAKTHKLIWLKYAYRGTAIWTGPGDSIYEYRWHDKNTHIMWILKR